MKGLISFITATAIGSAAAPAIAVATEMEYGGTFCSHSISTMVQAGPDAIALNIEAWGVQTPDSTFKPWANATNHCLVNVTIVQGKTSAHGECLWTDADGDTFLGEHTDVPGKPGGVWTFLAGTGKWKGVTGSGTYQYVSSSKPRPDGTGEGCITHSGKLSLP
jgi:hypothetical protein